MVMWHLLGTIQGTLWTPYASQKVWFNYSTCRKKHRKTPNKTTGQIIATSQDLGPQKVAQKTELAIG